MKTKTTLTRRVLALCMSVLMLMTAWVFVAPTKAAAAADVWDGTINDNSGFYNNEIHSARALAYFLNTIYNGNSYSGQTVKLCVDVDLNGIDFQYNVWEYTDSKIFEGTFDGQNHTIANFKMTHDNHRVAMFRTAKNATFKNVTFTNVFIDDWASNNKKNGFAVLVGYGDGNLTFENVHVTSGEIYGYNYVGGLVGEYGANNILTFTNCSNGAKIYADNERAAGLVGHSKGRVYATNCSNTGEIYAGYSDAGGIAGWIEDDESYFVNCSNTGKVSTDACAGGIFGYFGSKSNDNKMTITGCTNTGYIESRAKVAGGIAGMLDTDGAHSVEDNTNRGDVYGRDDVGGIVGSNIGSGTWRNNKNYGSVRCDNDNAGGILGEVEDDQNKFYNCYNSGAVEGKNSVGGIFGYGQNANHEFYDCGNSGAITSKSDAAGGIFGYGNESEPIIEQCWNIGTVKAYNDAGGILGRTYHHSYIRRCWNAGSIETYNHNDNGAHGGIAGQTSDKSGSSNDNPNMTDCFNWGPVSGGRDDGGLIGKIKDGRTPYYITNSYNAGTVTGVRPFAIIAYGGNVGNNVYYNNNVAMGTAQGSGISENDLNNSSGFSGNYCKNTWGVSIGGRTYRFPILNWYRNLFMFHLKFQDAPSGTNVYWDGEYNSAFYAPNPTRRGYTTDHWFLTTDANKTIAIPTEIITCGVTPCTDSLLMTQSFSEVTDVSNDSTFNLTWQKIKQKLDMNAVLNGEYKFDNINFFTADVYVNGTKVADDVNDFYQDLEFEDTYEITDIKTADGYRFVGAYDGIHDGRQQSGLTGQMDIDLIEVAPEFKTLHTVTVTPGTGTTIAGAESGTYAWGDTVTVTAAAETGYDQSAPVLKVNGNTIENGSAITITGETTITTDNLNKNTYTVTFKNGYTNETIDTQTVAYGAAATAPDAPQHIKIDGNSAKHMKFTGWDKAFDSVTGELTVTAQYAEDAHSYGAYTGGTDNHSRTCSACGFVDTKAHTPGEPVRENEKAASCSAEGSYDEVVYCSVCGEELSREAKTIDKLAHTPGEPVRENEKAASCSAEGSYDEVVYCTECNAVISRETKTIEKLAHTPEVIPGKAATCTETGLTEGSKCSVCGEILTAQQPIEKLAHTPGEPVRENEVPASCSAEGSYDEVVYCSVCNEELSRETKTIDKLPHDFTVPQSDNTYHWMKCENCGEINGKEEHNFATKGDEVTPASCGHNATATYSCSCGKTTVKEVPGTALEHAFTVLKTDDTYHWYECANDCGEINGKEEHNFATKGDEVTPASCGHNATATYSCSCGKTTVKEVPGTALEHAFTVLKTDDTYHWYECANDCGEINGKEEHNFATKGDEVTPASCGHNGTATYSCTCGKTTVKEVPGTALEHAFTVLKTDDTYHWYECANNCGTTTEKESHKGGTATCTEKATCSVCSTVYGNFDYTNHSTDATVKKNEKAAGYTFKGYTGDIYCAACDHLKETGTEIDKLKLSDNETVKSANEILAAEEAAPGTYDAEKIAALEDALHDLETLVNGTDEDAVVNKIAELGNLITSIEPIAYVTVTFTVDGETVSSQTIKAGADATAPEQAQYIIDGDSHKVFSGWTGDYTNVTADVTVTASYTTEAHSWIDGDVTKTPTCTEAGTQAQSCVCGATHEKTLEKDPANHTGNNTTTRENEVPATCTAAGSYVEVVTCECGAVISRTNKTAGNALGHDWGEWVITKNATCTEEGSKTRTCKNDSTHVETQAIAKIAHTDANGDTLCDVCGQPMANHQHTDVNGDGKCDTCGRDTDAHRHTDTNGDNVCDNCGKTINTSFRCSMCDYNDQHRNTPVFGWFVIIIHFFVHLFAQMKAWV